MKNTVILPPDAILVVAVPNSPLPSFFSIHDRPAYVPATVKAIFPAHLETEIGCYHTCIVEFGCNLADVFSQIAAEYALQIEREAYELSHLEEEHTY
jgi:hypothetical protein